MVSVILTRKLSMFGLINETCLDYYMILEWKNVENSYNHDYNFLIFVTR